MRTYLVVILSLLSATRAFAAEPAAQSKGGLLDPHIGLMFWTLAIFVLLYVILKRYAFPLIFAAVEQRERALTEAIEAAKRDREEATKLMEQQRAELDRARGEAQRLIAQGHQAGEKIRADMLEQTRREQTEMIERVRREIQSEKERAVAELRREAVELAIRGASKVIERNLDDQQNRRLVETFLADLKAEQV